MTGMENRRRKSASRFIEEILLDLGLFNSVVAKRLALRSLTIWTRRWYSMHPQRSAMNEMLNAVTESIDDVRRGFRLEADQVDD